MKFTPEMHQSITFQVLVEFLPNKKENVMNLMSKLAHYNKVHICAYVVSSKCDMHRMYLSGVYNV